MSKNSAGDRLCLGEQLEEMPRVAESLSAGGIGYQAASVICHPQPHVGEIGARLDEEMWIDFARKFSIKDLSDIAARTWHEVDPEGFCRELEENFERRQLFISESGGMYRLDGWLDPAAGAALKSAIDALAKPLGSEDKRTPRQRRADALTELTYHALEAGTMPRRNRVRPHINVNTTIEGLKGELGAAASEMQNGMPVSSKTVQRLACDGTLSRVLKADSVVVDVGHATQAVSPAQWRPSRHGTARAAFRNATGLSTGRVHTTSSSTVEAGRPACPTCFPSATTITAWCMKATGKLSKPAKASSFFRDGGANGRPSRGTAST